MSVAHKDELVEFVTKHPQLNLGKFSKDFTFKSAQNLWSTLANKLNYMPSGAKKDWKQWRKVSISCLLSNYSLFQFPSLSGETMLYREWLSVVYQSQKGV